MSWRSLYFNASWKTWAFCGTCVLVLFAGTACERSDDAGGTDPAGQETTAANGTSSGAADSAAALSPQEVVRRVNQHRRADELSEVEQYLVPELAPYLISFVNAIDKMLQANRVVLAAVTKHFGQAAATEFDRSGIGDMLGVLARDVKVVDQQINGDQAVVSLQVGGRMPLQQAHLIRRDGRWLIVTEQPVPGLPEAFNDLAEAMMESARLLESREMSKEAFKQELALRRAPIQRRLQQIHQQLQARQPDEP